MNSRKGFLGFRGFWVVWGALGLQPPRVNLGFRVAGKDKLPGRSKSRLFSRKWGEWIMETIIGDYIGTTIGIQLPIPYTKHQTEICLLGAQHCTNCHGVESPVSRCQNAVVKEYQPQTSVLKLAAGWFTLRTCPPFSLQAS